MAYKVRMINELRQDLEGSGSDPNEILSQNLPGVTIENLGRVVGCPD
jgi:hypothetical protein